jgi:hypothetical protein
MTNSQVLPFADVTEVAEVYGPTAANKLLTEGWQLAGLFQITRLREGDPTTSTSPWVRRAVGYVLVRRGTRQDQDQDHGQDQDQDQPP